MRLRLTGATAGLAVGVTLAVTSASALGAYLYSRHHYESLLASARATALMQGELIRAGLEHQMLENRRDLIRQMVEGVSTDPARKGSDFQPGFILGQKARSPAGLSDFLVWTHHPNIPQRTWLVAPMLLADPKLVYGPAGLNQVWITLGVLPAALSQRDPGTADLSEIQNPLFPL